MRIGFDAKRAFFNNSGLGNYSRTLVSQLCTLFPENEYFLFSPKESGKRENFPPINTVTVGPEKFLHKKFSSVWRSAFMGSGIKGKSIDLFHGLSNELPSDIKKSNAVSLVTIHDLIFLRYPNLYKRIDRKIYESKFKRSCLDADKIVAISEQTKSDIIQFFGINESKIQVIYQSCNPLYYQPCSTEQKDKVRNKFSLPETYLLYVGTIEERKNLLQIIKARHQGKITTPLIVIGRPTAYYEKIKEYISSNSITGIHFLKDVSLWDIPAIYQMSEMFIYPSSFEGFGIPVIEALNSGTPVITGKGSCLPEAGGPNSLYVDPMEVDEITNAIQTILGNPDLRKTMISKGNKHALNFREDKTAAVMMQLYQSLL